MSNRNSYLGDQTYQKAKVILGRKKARDMAKDAEQVAYVYLFPDATQTQKKAFNRGKKDAQRLKEYVKGAR